MRGRETRNLTDDTLLPLLVATRYSFWSDPWLPLEILGNQRPAMLTGATRQIGGARLSMHSCIEEHLLQIMHHNFQTRLHISVKKN